jgi:NDP-sugar pyrophosphorylase family protein
LTAFRTAVIPCAGLGTRMRPLLGDRPKALLEIAGRSVLAHAMGEAAGAGLTEIVVVAHPSGREALEREANRWARQVQVVEQPSPRGLADAIRRGARAAGGAFAVLLPDNLFESPSPLARLLALATTAGEHAVLVARMTAETARGKGSSAPATVEPLGTDPDAVRVVRVGSKRGQARLALGPGEHFDTPIGRYAFLPDVIRATDTVELGLGSGEELDDVPLLRHLATERALVGLLYGTPFYDVGNPDGYRAAQERLGT